MEKIKTEAPFYLFLVPFRLVLMLPEEERMVNLFEILFEFFPPLPLLTVLCEVGFGGRLKKEVSHEAFVPCLIRCWQKTIAVWWAQSDQDQV